MYTYRIDRSSKAVDISFTYTYTHNWSLQAFIQDYDLASDITYVVCINFMHEWWEEVATEIFFHIFVLMSGLGCEPGLYI